MTEHTLLIRLAGPLQSWGVRARHTEHDTHLRPTKSGTVGMLAAALGRDHRDDITDLAHLRFATRGDRMGRPTRDYNTVGGGTYPLRPLDLITDHHRAQRVEHATSTATGPHLGYLATHAAGRWYGAPKYIAPDPDTGTLIAAKADRAGLQREKWYLADAAFVAAFQHTDPDFLHTIAAALEQPKRLLWLGRKNCPPAGEIVQGVHPGTVEHVLAATQLLPNATQQSPWTWIEQPASGSRGQLINDQPLSYDRENRQYVDRREQRLRITPGTTHTWSDLL